MDLNILLTAIGNKDHIIYPRFLKLLERCGGTEDALRNTDLPSLKDIIAIIKKALKDAEEELKKLGVECDGKGKYLFDSRLASSSSCQDSDLVDECDEAPRNEEDGASAESSSGENIDAASDEECEDYDRHDFEVLRSLHEVDLRDFSQKMGNACDKNFGTLLSKSKHFVAIADVNGNVRIVKKSCIVWYLECNVRKLSNDRILRVQLQTPYLDRQKLIVKSVERRQKLRMGDWAIFMTEDGSGLSQKFLLGRTISFSVLKGTAQELKKRIWEWDEGVPDIGVLCAWYEIECKNRKITGSLKQMYATSHGFHPCSNYVCSVPPPCFQNMTLSIPADICDTIAQEVLHLM